MRDVERYKQIERQRDRERIRDIFNNDIQNCTM